MQINEFVKLGGDQLVPYYADILGAILPCISDKEEKIRVVSWLILYLSFLSLSLSLIFIPFLHNLSSVRALKKATLENPTLPQAREKIVGGYNSFVHIILNFFPFLLL